MLNHSKSTVARYVKGVNVLPEFHRAWKAKRGGSTSRAESRRQKFYSKSLDIVGNLTSRDHLIVAACLYWGEGNKKEFSFSNTDPRLIETFLKCLARLGIEKKRLKISIRVYEDINQDEAKRYWAKIVGIAPHQIASVNVLVGKKLGKLRYGMCRIRLAKGNDYFNLLTATIRVVSKNFAPIAQRTEQRTPKP